MLGTIIGLLFALIIMGAIWWGIQQLLPLMPVAEPFATIIRVVLGLLLVFIVLYVIAALLGIGGIRVPRWT